MNNSVFIITTEFPPNSGGIGNHAYNLAKSLAHEGFTVTVMCDIINVEQHVLNAFANHENFKIIWIKRSSFLPKTYFQRIVTALTHSAKAGTVICSGKFSLWLGLIITLFNKQANLVAVAHGSELDLKSALAKKVTSNALNRFGKIISVSNYTQGFVDAILKKPKTKNVIPNGINLEDFNEPHAALPLKGEPSLITIGSVTERKGQENVVRALPVIAKACPGVHYHLVGKPVIKARLKLVAAQLNVSPKITFHGVVERSELLDKLSAAKIKLMLSVHTTQGEFEGFGIAVLEANAVGIPVIGSRNSGIADAIDDGKTGLLVDPGNAEEITAAIAQINNNYILFSGNAKAWAAKHDWRIIVKKYISVLQH